MNYRHLPIICLILATVVVTTYAQNESTNDWHPNTDLLDSAAKRHDPIEKDAGSTLAHDVKHFYQALRDKRWHETYRLRAQVFRDAIPESDYFAVALNQGQKWGLVNYEVLSLIFTNSEPTNGLDTAILICKFTEVPGHIDSYSTVFWHKEEGVWKCLSAGPSGLTIFDGTRLPMIDWR